MLYCSEVTQELERLKFEEGTFIKRFLLRFHLLICKDCRRYESDSKALDHILKFQNPVNYSKLTSEEIEAMNKKIIG